MIRIHFTAEDFARVRFTARPAPLQELNAAFMTMFHPDGGPLFGRWRGRLLRALPTAVEPLGELVPAGRAPRFLDVFGDTLEEALDTVRASRPEVVRAEIERVYATHPAPAPPWVRDLHRGDAAAWQVLRRAQHAAFETVVRPVWEQVRDLHQREFARHALATAEHGVGAALTALVPGSRLRDGVWEWQDPGGPGGPGGPGDPGDPGDSGASDQDRDIRLRGRGVVLLPTFHWTGHPLLADAPDGPLHLTYAAGPGLPLTQAQAPGTEDALAAVLGRTRLDVLLLLGEGHTTSGLARRLRVSNATASAPAAALRGAGLITTVRAGKSVLHARTALGTLLVRRHDGAR
ncbi:helix-turn-helix domain-containing protein [Streptomyces sp. NPDC003036]|uniref:helix-turn-helix domain-containing protein n=1 Tax=Streptomyces sp. NPDC003036 TaxID=3154442 RepID=UPI0033B8D24C